MICTFALVIHLALAFVNSWLKLASHLQTCSKMQDAFYYEPNWRICPCGGVNCMIWRIHLNSRIWGKLKRVIVIVKCEIPSLPSLVSPSRMSLSALPTLSILLLTRVLVTVLLLLYFNFVICLLLRFPCSLFVLELSVCYIFKPFLACSMLVKLVCPGSCVLDLLSTFVAKCNVWS